MPNISLGFSDFYIANSKKEMGNSYTTLPNLSILNMIYLMWDKRQPGMGEGSRLDRKVLVPVEPRYLSDPHPCFFCPSRVKLSLGMPLKAEVVARQEGEDPFVDVFITPEDAVNFAFVETPAHKASFVVYSSGALLENNGKRSTNSDWEIVTLLCESSSVDLDKIMEPLTMARNWKELVGGTKPSVPYTCDEWAEAVLAAKSRGIKVRKPRY